MRSFRISAVLVAVLALIAVLAGPSQAAKHGRPHGITITCGHHKCHKKHRCKHGSRHHHKCNRHRHGAGHCRGCHPGGYPAPKPKPIPGEGEVNLTPPIAEEGDTRKCAYVEDGCRFEANNLEVYEIVGEKVTPATWASANLYWPLGDEVTIRFLAEYGTFESRVYGSGKYGPPNRYVSKYIPPAEEWKMPASGYDTAWVVIIDRSTETYVESEKVRFNIEEPENVHEVHPVG